MLKQKSFKVTGWGKMLVGQLYLPDTPGKYPAVVFFHGLGANNPATFLTEGPMYWINKGWKPNLVMFGIAGPGSYPPEPIEMKYVLENDPEIQQYYDDKNVMWTGLSQGGFSTLLCVSNKFDGVFVPMSSPAFDANQIDGSKAWKAWAFHSDNDNTCPLPNVIAAYDKIKAKKTVNKHDGHGNWNAYYDPNSPDGNVFDWAFGTSTPTPPQPPQPSREIDFTIVYYKDGTFEKK